MKNKRFIELLVGQIEEANKIKSIPDCPLDENCSWRTYTRSILVKAFGGKSINVAEFDLTDHGDQIFFPNSGPSDWDHNLKRCIEGLINKLESNINILRLDDELPDSHLKIDAEVTQSEPKSKGSMPRNKAEKDRPGLVVTREEAKSRIEIQLSNADKLENWSWVKMPMLIVGIHSHPNF